MRVFFIFGLIITLILSGCGSSSSGSIRGSITISADSQTITGTSFDSGHQKKWSWSLTFRETSGVAVTLTQYANTIAGNNGYCPEPFTGNQQIALTASGSITLNFDLLSGSNSLGQPLFTTGTSRWQFTGADNNGNPISVEITLNLI